MKGGYAKRKATVARDVPAHCGKRNHSEMGILEERRATAFEFFRSKVQAALQGNRGSGDRVVTEAPVDSRKTWCNAKSDLPT